MDLLIGIVFAALCYCIGLGITHYAMKYLGAK